ncbi:MAG: hypothetical protein AAGI66_05730 [Cyanobacteria bacterium P01_H01_bin.74]
MENVLLRAKENKTAEEIAVILEIAPKILQKHRTRYFEMIN